MIAYDLQCTKGHAFEGWFEDRKAYLDQKKKGLITCPICNVTSVDIVPSTFAIKSGAPSISKEFAAERRRGRLAANPTVGRLTADGPNRLWVADITYVPTWAGFLYLAVVLGRILTPHRRLGDGQAHQSASSSSGVAHGDSTKTATEGCDSSHRSRKSIC